MINLSPGTLHRFDQAIQYEWLETNGLGGYASSTVIGAHHRRYHGLLVAATKPPVKRMVMLSKLEESIITPNHTYELGANKYPGAVHPNGYIFLKEFSQELFPSFLYEVPGIQIRKTITAIHGENTVVEKFEVLKADEPFVLKLQPMYAPRDYHNLAVANGQLDGGYTFEDGVFSTQPYEDQPKLFIKVPGASFLPQADWFYQVEYQEELNRGLEGHEDLFSPGNFVVKLEEGQTLYVTASLIDPTYRVAEELIENETLRRENLVRKAGFQDPMIQQLVLAADQFIVRRGDGLKTVVAGYPWFTDWGRDTMISLPGLCLATGRADDAKKILMSFAENVSEGMIPNRFPDNGTEPLYNTIDGTLWFFVAIHKYLETTRDEQFVVEHMMPVLKEILDWHERGTRFGIRMDGDGLLTGGEDGFALTWMDAKAHDWVVTPRKGKAVEINALWYNAWSIYAEILRIAGKEEEASVVEGRAEAVRLTFLREFWNPQTLALFDFIDGNHKDGTIRPNQIFAISLPFPLLDMDQSYQVLDRVERELLTPVGLRSLSSEDPLYRPTYEGDQYGRDGAYHQGTVWSWLLGPYLDALVRIRGGWGRDMAKMIIEQMGTHLGQAGVGSISEIFDGDKPHTPRGCTAQAWGVAELLRPVAEYNLYGQRKPTPSVSFERAVKPDPALQPASQGSH